MMFFRFTRVNFQIRATDDFKEHEMVFMNVDVPMNQPQPVVSTQGTHRSTPRAHRTPTLTASPQRKKRKKIVRKSTAKAQENVAKVQEKLDEEEIKKMVEEPGGHKEHPEHVSYEDEEIEKEKKDEEVEKEKEDVEIEKEKDIADDGMGSTEIRKRAEADTNSLTN
nr:hypothetical protein [Tanacetum cinerariifolium]